MNMNALRSYFFSTLVLIIFIVLLFPFNVLAQQSKPSPAPSPAPVPTVNLYELIWPLVAGMTVDDSLYFLKRIKEQVRGWFVFGTAQKADYAVFLGVKRVLEAEKLIKEKKTELANATFDEALKELTKAEETVSLALEKKENLGSTRQTMSDRLTNVVKLTTWLTTQTEKNNDKLQQVHSKAESLLRKLQGS